MNIINLRNVGSLEIPDSYRGILRISPNDGEDDPSKLLLNFKSVELSDSEGNLLPLKFIPKKFSTIVVGRGNDKDDKTTIDMIHMTHEYGNLFINKNLNIRSHVYINTSSTTIPLIFSDGTNSVGYPLESPCDTSYFNYNNKHRFSSDDSYEINLEKIEADDDLYTKDENQWIKINGQFLHNYIKQEDGSYLKLPLIKRKDYTLGHTQGQRYKKENASEAIHDLSDDEITSNSHTQLSFIPLESLIYSTIESLCSGLYRAPINGRYYGLYPIYNSNGTINNDSQNKLGDTLFGNKDENEENLNKLAPILAVPVQSGTIHYNAIPPHNYFFHLVRHYQGNSTDFDISDYLENNSSTITFASEMPTKMAALTKQYVLCDGKNIKNDYPNIDKKEFEDNYGAIHKAIAKSMLNEIPEKDSDGSDWEPMLENQQDGSSEENDSDIQGFNTPPLFEFDQLSLRFLRGLNWLRYYNVTDENNKKISIFYDTEDKNSEECPVINRDETIEINKIKYPIHFQDNIYPYIKIKNNDDPANIIKDIHEVGMYYSNTDISLQKERKHFHLSFAAPQDEVDTSKADNLKKEQQMFVGNSDSELPANSSEWKKYVNIDNDSATINTSFLGTKILKTAGSILLDNSTTANKERLRKLQNYPISAKGGGITQMHEVAQCVRYGKHIYILVGVKCMNHRTSCQEFLLRDSYYQLASHKISEPTNEIDAASTTSLQNSKWRLISSLPRGNKYGKINVFTTDFSEAKFTKASSNGKSSKDKTEEDNILSLKIDDSLCSPTSNNFIPLMKI